MQHGTGVQQHKQRRRTTQALEEIPVHVTRTWFRFYWIVFVVIHAMDGLFLVGVSTLYYWLLYQPVVQVNVQAELHLLPISTIRSLVWVFPVLATGHLWTVVEFLVHSIQSHQLTLTSPSRDLSCDARPKLVLSKTGQRLRSVLTKWVYPLVTLDNKHFEIFTIQEIFQIVSQTYQCYSLSRLVATKWINQLAVASTCLLCVAPPVIRLLISGDIPRQRFYCVLIDCTMSFVQAVAIPLIIVWPYFQTFHTEYSYFPEELVYNAVWYSEAVQNLDQIFLVSYFDFFATAWPHLHFLRALRGISQLLRPIDRLDGNGNLSAATVVPVSTQSGTSRSEKRDRNTMPIGLSFRSSSLQARRSIIKGFLSFFYGALCILHGSVVVIIHLAAKNNDPIASMNCLLHPNPWFTSRFACSVINVDCYHSGILGNTTEVASLLQRFDPLSSLILIFSHCPALEMPPAIVDFAMLKGMDIYNSTLVKWTSEAALRQETHPVFSFFTVARTNLTEIPEGIRGDTLPSMFSDVAFSRTNLSTLPPDVGTQWINVNSLYLEYCELMELPASLTHLRLEYFSAVGNHLERIEDQLLQDDSLSEFLVSNNPLTTVPKSLGDLSDTSVLFLEFTHVHEVPTMVIDWALDRLDRGLFITHSAFGSPFCDTAQAMNNDPRLTRYKAFACAGDLKSSNGDYPIEILDAQLAI